MKKGLGNRLKEAYERVVSMRSVADIAALSLINTPIDATIEMGVADMSAHDSGDVRMLMAPTNILTGMIRDYTEEKARLNPNNDTSKRRWVNTLWGVGMGGIQIGLSVGRYAVTRAIKGQPFELKDCSAGILSGLYTMGAGNLMCIAMDTFRDGLEGSREGKSYARSLFPKDMNPELKRKITQTTSAGIALGMAGFYLISR